MCLTCGLLASFRHLFLVNKIFVVPQDGRELLRTCQKKHQHINLACESWSFLHVLAVPAAGERALRWTGCWLCAWDERIWGWWGSGIWHLRKTYREETVLTVRDLQDVSRCSRILRLGTKGSLILDDPCMFGNVWLAQRCGATLITGTIWVCHLRTV